MISRNLLLFQKQIFIPPHRRIEEKADEQRNMEQAFEDMYLQATGEWEFNPGTVLNGACCLAAIVGPTILEQCHVVQSL